MCRWITSWHKYTEQDPDTYFFDNNSTDFQSSALAKTVERPGPIDNSDIVLKGIDTEGDELEINRALQEGLDYVLVPQGVWEKLFEW